MWVVGCQHMAWRLWYCITCTRHFSRDHKESRSTWFAKCDSVQLSKPEWLEMTIRYKRSMVRAYPHKSFRHCFPSTLD